ncbi:hypothetical protein FACS1894122_09620 [Alphaproteobacteria bacterium]|nr:hypothetical protein FACS1894122_09620 [Alphaproteobacteria bacterium]
MRTRVKVNIGYKAFYVYSAIDAKTDSNFSMGFPHVDTATMNIFLQELSKIYEGLTIALIIDGAGWHKSDDLEIPENIDIFILPPYSPELNPVERFWEYVKKNILHNRLFETLEEIEEALQAFIDSLQDSVIAQLCKNNYLDI